MKKTIHVHQQRIRTNLPAIIVRTYKGVRYYRRVEIKGPSTIVHSSTPDHCGARVWIETESEVSGVE